MNTSAAILITFTSIIEKFGAKGDKTGWTYLTVPEEQAAKLKPGNRKSFKVKGKLDQHPIKMVSLIPMGDGSFILPVNAAMRKGLAKPLGATVKLSLQEDKSEFVFNPVFLECLADEPRAEAFFQQLPGSHQRYFSKWIDEAKTEATRVKRIAMAVSALAREMGYGEMLRADKEERNQLGR